MLGHATSYPGHIDYNFREVTYGTGEITYSTTVFDTVELTIDSIEVTEHVPVPLPGSVVLLASAMATIASFRKKLPRSA